MQDASGVLPSRVAYLPSAWYSLVLTSKTEEWLSMQEGSTLRRYWKVNDIIEQFI